MINYIKSQKEIFVLFILLIAFFLNNIHKINGKVVMFQYRLNTRITVKRIKVSAHM